MDVLCLEAWPPKAGLKTTYPCPGQDLNKALGDLVLYNFSANTWERWDLSPAPVGTLFWLEELVPASDPALGVTSIVSISSPTRCPSTIV